MKNFTIMVAMLFSMGAAYSQVGVNTTNPQGIFNVDGAKDNSSTGVPSVTAQDNDVVIDATGKVGIGTATPGAKLDIISNNPIEALNLTRYVGANGYENIIRMNRARGTSASPEAVVSGDNIASLAFGAYDGTNNLYSAVINSVINGTVSTGNVPQDLYFATGNNDSRPERMRITATGNVGIGTAIPGATLEVKSNSNTTSEPLLIINRTGGSASNGFLFVDGLATGEYSGLTRNGDVGIIFDTDASPSVATNGLVIAAHTLGTSNIGIRIQEDGNVGIGLSNPSQRLHVAGNVLASNVSVPSDARLKKNILPLTKAIDKVNQLNPVEYDKKESLIATEYKTHEMGLIAQELQKVLPSLVLEGSDKEKLLSVNYAGIVPLLIKAIQELSENNKELQSRVEQLEKK